MKRKKLLSLHVVLVVVFAVSVSMSLRAATTDNVTATVTAQNISVTISANDTVAYGTISTGATQDTTSSGVNTTPRASNDGNVMEDFNVQGANTASWTLAATAGAEQYTHKFCTSNCDSSPTWTTITSGGYTQIANDIAASSGYQDFDLQIGTPTSTADYTQQTSALTIQAVYYQ